MITQKDIRIVGLAKKVLRMSTHPRYKIGAVLVKGGRVISLGVNKIGSHKRFITPHRNNYSHHAEVDAILNISKESSRGATLVVAGQTASGSLINVKPCYTCSKLLNLAMVKRIVYLDKDQVKEI